MLWHVFRPRYARITRFARAQNRLSPILSNKGCPPPSGPPIKNPGARPWFFIGGQRGIRTLERLSPLHTFQACAFNHSATCPSKEKGRYTGLSVAARPAQVFPAKGLFRP